MEKMEVMKAVRGGERNVNASPVVASLKYELVVERDFESGLVISLGEISHVAAANAYPFFVPRSCKAPATFIVSNRSLTHPTNFVFREQERIFAVRASSASSLIGVVD